MPWIDAFGPAEQANQEAVMRETWGHLAPHKNRTYKGYFVIAVGVYDHLNPTVISCEFSGLDDSPWFYDSLHEFIHERNQVTGGITREYRFAAGGVYRFDGVWRNYGFRGRFRQLRLT